MSNETRRILLVEDEKAIRDAVTAYLERENYWVTAVGDGQEALEEFSKHHFDLVILDLMLPRVPGERVCRAIRDNSDVPIIMLTAKGEVEDRIIGLELGADDYLVKPFDKDELLLRIEAILRRTMGLYESADLVFKGLVVSPTKRTASIDGEPLALKGKQFDALEYLVSRQGQLVSKSQLFDKVWGFLSDTSSNVVEVYMSAVRKQLKPFGYDAYLKTIRGVGYLLTDEVDHA